jgi:hypothetical protein
LDSPPSANFLHSPLECVNYDFFPKGKFSHSRYFMILFRKFFFRRVTHFPYLSGDSFANLADYIAFGKDGRKGISPNKLKKAHILFVPGNRLSELLVKHSDLINARVIVTGNSDENFEKFIELPASVNIWLCQNGIGDSAIWRTLPIGLENARLGRYSLRKYLRGSQSKTKTLKILVPPMSPTNPSRYQSIYTAQKDPQVFTVTMKPLAEKDYYELANSFQFILCCEGNGFDTHRLWETLYLGCFPVLLDSLWAQSLRYLNLPILVVKNLGEINLEMLQDFCLANEGFNPLDHEVLWMPYWKRLLQSQ